MYLVFYDLKTIDVLKEDKYSIYNSSHSRYPTNNAKKTKI